ncbi:viroplasmin family protein [Mesoplasma photuris]|uniref:ribonuclease H1 domain-containing protein n=1 Tax=Mesoplasma photuris TaxID=217731 RepID=UPI0004E11367|nr:ribonuclease H family protein [Mesoplasma photuris]
MSKKYYAVKKGFKTGVFETWEETKSYIDGFSGAVYKSFKTKNEAWDFLRNKPTSEVKAKPIVKKPFGLEDLVSAIAYTDGSYLSEGNNYSYGTVVLWKDREYYFSQRFNDQENASLRNVAGELEGAKKAMKFAFDQKIQYLIIHHDYQGVASWATREWKANLPATQAYQEFYDQISTRVNVEFKWVKGHSGDHYNDLADQLAANATFELYEGVK